MRTTLPTLATLLALNTAAQWTPVGSGLDYYVHCSAVYNDEVYVGGNFEHAGGIECLGIARWNGSAWSDVGGGFQHGAISHVVSALTVFNGELIAAGWVDSVGGQAINHVARWNGTSWSPMGTDLQVNTPRGFAVHNGELYICGQGSGAIYPHCIEKWDGANWIPIENGNGSTEVSSIASYNGELYASGNFATLNGVTVNGVARWNGSTWSDVGGGVPNITFTDIVKTLAVYNGKLYAGGHFLAMGTATVNDIAAWDGSTWSDVGGGVGGATAGIQCLVPNGDKLFVGGSFWTVNGVDANRSAYWNGSAWTVLGMDLGAGARTQAVYDGSLYSFGEGAFNGQSYAARWTSDVFSGIDDVLASSTMQLAPNPLVNGEVLNVTLGSASFSGSTQLTILAADGRVVRNERMNAGANGRVEVPVSGLNSGTYVLRVNSGDGLRTARLVVR